MLERCDLAVGAGAAGEDLAGVRYLADATEVTRVLLDEDKYLFEQLSVGHDRAPAKIDEPLVEPVARRAPAVLVDQHARIEPPALVLALQAPQHAQNAAEEGGNRQRVFERRAAIGDAHFEGRKAVARPQIPPQFRAVLDQPGADQNVDVAPVFAPAGEPLRSTGARHLVKDGEAVGFEPVVLALPERRRGRQCQQVRQEVRGLVQQIDAQLVVGDADMDVHSADREARADALQIALEALVADTLGGLLLLPSRKWMGRHGNRGHAMARRHRRDPDPQPPQLGSRFVETCADPGPDLDLRAQKFRAHLGAQQRLELGQHAIGRVAHDVPRRPIDEDTFLLESERKFRFGSHLTPRIEPVTERGSRRGQRPLSTWWRKSAQVRLKRSGSSRFTACPVFGKTTSAAVGIVRFINRPGSRHGSSSSPVMIRVGTSRLRMRSVRSHSEGRRAWTPRIVFAEPKVECSARLAANSAQPRGSLFWNWTREGPIA